MERTGQGLEGVVVARILASVKHPDAEKLSVTSVDRGDGQPLQVVCGAKNYQVGDMVPLATVGTTLPGGTRIKKAKLRGVESFGMLCSARELGLSEDASGLLILDPGLAPGTPIASGAPASRTCSSRSTSPPTGPTPSPTWASPARWRPRWGRRSKRPAAAPREEGPPAAEAVAVRIEAPEKCARYAARVVEGVTIGPSPLWLQRRLERCGIRAISNVVDVTNLVLLELGHPLHAFDLDKVAGAEIVVRTARPGERMTTLDGKERALDPDDLVIADRDRSSALAGVMGGGDSEISPGTRRVLVESAWFQPATVRRTARRHGLHTEASHRFERGADPGMVATALDRCAALIAELAGGTVRPGRGRRAARVRRRGPRCGSAGSGPASCSASRWPPATSGASSAASASRSATRTARGPAGRCRAGASTSSIEEDLVEELIRTLGYQADPRDPAAAGARHAGAAAAPRGARPAPGPRWRGRASARW